MSTMKFEEEKTVETNHGDPEDESMNFRSSQFNTSNDTRVCETMISYNGPSEYNKNVP